MKGVLYLWKWVVDMLIFFFYLFMSLLLFLILGFLKVFVVFGSVIFWKFTTGWIGIFLVWFFCLEIRESKCLLVV